MKKLQFFERGSLKIRLIGTLVNAIILFVLLAVVHGIFIYREDWLIYTISWTLFWSLGFFTSKTITETLMLSYVTVILCEIAICIAVAILLSVIVRFFLKVGPFSYLISSCLFAFSVSLLLNNDWRNSILKKRLIEKNRKLQAEELEEKK